MLENETAEQLLARYKQELIDIQPYLLNKPKLVARDTFLRAEILRISGIPAE